MSDSDPDPQPAVRARREPPSRDPQEWMGRPLEDYRRAKFQLEYRPSDAFFELADFVMRRKRTLLAYDRLYVFWQAAANLANVPGAVAEVGS